MARHASTSVALRVAKDAERGNTENGSAKKGVSLYDLIVYNFGKCKRHPFFMTEKSSKQKK